MEKICKNCQFAKEGLFGYAFGNKIKKNFCYRYPPKPMEEIMSVRPIVNDNDFCGEFKKKKDD